MESERVLKQTLGLPDSVWLGQVAIDFAQPQLGVGSDAIVFRCVHDGVPVAAKVLHSALIAPNNEGRNDFIANFGRECSRLRQLAHPCVVSFIGVGQAPNKAPCLVVELMQESLADRMKAEPADPVLQSLIYLMDVAGGLRYLHWQLLVHRDLKPQNILLAAGRAKIADVGLARSLHGDEGMAEQVMTRCPGTPNYMAPESLEEGKPYDDKLDMFALGAIILGVINHREPRPKVKEIRILANGRRVAMTELERRADDLGRMDVNHPTRPLVVSCLQDEPALRPTATQAHHQLMIIHQGFAGADKPLLSATLAEVVGRLDTLATAQQESQQNQEQISLLRQEIRSQQATAVGRAAEVGQLRQQVERQHQQMERQHQQIERQQRQHQQMERQHQQVESQHLQTERQHQEQLASLRQEIRSQRATTESAAVARAAEVGQLRQQVEPPRQQLDLQLQQQQHATTRREMLSQQGTTQSTGVSRAAEVLPRPRTRERRLNWELLRDVVSKRQWSRCKAIDSGGGGNGRCVCCVCANTLFVVYQTDGKVRVCKTTDLQSWKLLPKPSAGAVWCYALVSTGTHVHMVYRVMGGDVFIASLKADGSASKWEVSPSPCPATMQYRPAVAVLGSTVYLVGGLNNNQSTTSWYILDSKKWATTQEGGKVQQAQFPPVPDQLTHSDFVLCQGKWYSAGGELPGSSYGPTLPLHVLTHSEDGRRWERTALRSTPPHAGVLSHNDWLFVAGGATVKQPRKKNAVFCVDPANGRVVYLPPLPERRFSVFLVAFAGKFIAVGGCDDAMDWHYDMFTLDISV